MQQPFDQKFCLQQLGKSTFFTPKQGNKNFNPIAHQWHTSVIKLHQKCDRGVAKRNWLEGLSAKPGCCSLIFSQFVCWLERKQIPLLPRFLAFFWWFFTNLDIFPEHKIGKENEYSSTFANVIVVPIVAIPDYAKQIAYQRLQELAIPCWRTRDGDVWVEIKDVNVAILVHQTIKQSTTKNSELVQILYNCWNQDIHN